MSPSTSILIVAVASFLVTIIPSSVGEFQRPFKFDLPLRDVGLHPHGTSTFDQLEAPQVAIGRGTTIVGSVLHEAGWPRAVEAFRGVPYALPPVGDRRFRPLVPISSQGVINATRFGPRCPGKQLLQLPGSGGAESEDCLTLNVFRPEIADTDSETVKWPVAVYIHGGAFNRGTGA